MPLMTIRTNATVDKETVKATLTACSSKLALLLGKPESYVMTLFDRVTDMSMGGSDQPACLVEIRSVGKLSGEQTQEMSDVFCGLLSDRLKVDASRIFLNFTEYPGSMWGHDHSTFG